MQRIDELAELAVVTEVSLPGLRIESNTVFAGKEQLDAETLRVEVSKTERTRWFRTRDAVLLRVQTRTCSKLRNNLSTTKPFRKQSYAGRHVISYPADPRFPPKPVPAFRAGVAACDL